MADFNKITDTVFVSGQIQSGDLSAAAASGVKTVVNNRPDGEERNQPASAEIEAAAKAAGLAYAHVPVAGMGIGHEDLDAFDAAEKTGPVLAFCKSGLRSTLVWALAAARRGEQDVHDILETAREAGYDISGARAMIEAAAGQAQSTKP
ncbi:MAG: TIGR01244 family sulfur transferase [Pseudomonadota bacterium]